MLRKTHAVKRDMHQKRQAMRRRNFKNTILAEERKVRIQCRKQAHLRVHKDYVAEKREQARQARVSFLQILNTTLIAIFSYIFIT